MDYANPLMKWFSRLLLLSLVIAMAYVVSRPGYNFAHWIPHHLLRQIGVPYKLVLSAEQHADVALHLLGGALLTILLYMAKLPLLSQPAWRPLIVVATLCLMAELVQMRVGRGFQSGDLLLGILGSFMAYLAIDKKFQA